MAVVPGYYLVCYNKCVKEVIEEIAVVPGYYLVCYNSLLYGSCAMMLQFPVITWYVIIKQQ